MDDIRDVAITPETPTKSVHSLEDMGKLLEEYREALKAKRETLFFFESDEHWRNIIHSVLVYKGYDVDMVRNESEAIDCLEQSRPKVILIDLDAPENAGWRLLEKVAKMGIPSLVLTASEEVLISKRALKAGATEVITKPFVPVEFTSIIRKYWNQNDRHNSRKV